MIHIVTDSSANVVAQANVTVIPTYIYMGTDTLRDGVEMTPENMLGTLKRGPMEVTTSEPPASAFKEVFARILASDPQGTIFTMHVSAAISGTVASATRAARAFPEADIRVFDTQTCTVGHALLVLAASQHARDGMSADQLEETLLHLRAEGDIAIALGGMSALKGGGRLWRLALMARTDMDHLTPTITLNDGSLEGITPHRQLNDAYDELHELAVAARPGRVGVAYATDTDTAHTFANRLTGSLGVDLAYFAPFSATFAYYFAWGSIGVAWLPV